MRISARDALREDLATALLDLDIDVYGRIDCALLPLINAYAAQVRDDALTPVLTLCDEWENDRSLVKRAAVADVRRAAGVIEPSAEDQAASCGCGCKEVCMVPACGCDGTAHP